MNRRNIIFSLSFLLLLCAFAAGGFAEEAELALTAQPDQAGNVTLMVMVVKASEEVLQKGSTQTVSVPTMRISLGTVDEVRIKTEQDDDRKVGIVFLPGEWKMDQNGKNIKISGPAIHSADGFFLSVNLGKVKIPKDMPFQIFSGGKKVFDQKISVTLLPKLEVIDHLKDLRTMPRTAVPGEELQFTVLDTRQTPHEGRWTVGETAAEKFSLPGSPDIRYRARITEDAKVGDMFNVIYQDPWGRTMVNVTGSNGIRITPSPQDENPKIISCTPKAFSGNVICVCGWFPNRSWERLLLDGKPVGIPLGASTGTVHIALAGDMPIGSHVVTGDEAAGFAPSDRAETQVLQVLGELDRNKLWLKGQSSTPMRLFVLGTEEVMQLRIKNRTPPIITLEGGDDQVASTSGGKENKLEKKVQGVQVGNFEIYYELNLDPCPCGEH